MKPTRQRCTNPCSTGANSARTLPALSGKQKGIARALNFLKTANVDPKAVQAVLAYSRTTSNERARKDERNNTFRRVRWMTTSQLNKLKIKLSRPSRTKQTGQSQLSVPDTVVPKADPVWTLVNTMLKMTPPQKKELFNKLLPHRPPQRVPRRASSRPLGP